MSVADDLVAAFEPWMTTDLEQYLRAVGSMLSEVELYAFAEDDDMGWSILLDPDTCPVPALPYLAQYVGERLPVGLSEAQQREWIKDSPNQRRGTAKAIFLAAQRTLTDTRLVSLRERTKIDGSTDPDYLTVHTLISQTPDPQAVYEDLRDNIVPADIVLDYSAIIGETWQDVKDNNATWQDVKTTFATWQDVLVEVSGSSVFTRPLST